MNSSIYVISISMCTWSYYHQMAQIANHCQQFCLSICCTKCCTLVRMREEIYLGIMHPIRILPTLHCYCIWRLAALPQGIYLGAKSSQVWEGAPSELKPQSGSAGLQIDFQSAATRPGLKCPPSLSSTSGAYAARLLGTGRAQDSSSHWILSAG